MISRCGIRNDNRIRPTPHLSKLFNPQQISVPGMPAIACFILLTFLPFADSMPLQISAPNRKFNANCVQFAYEQMFTKK